MVAMKTVIMLRDADIGITSCSPLTAYLKNLLVHACTLSHSNVIFMQSFIVTQNMTIKIFCHRLAFITPQYREVKRT